MRRRSCGGRERRAVSDSGSSGRPKPHVGGQCGSEAAKMAVRTSGDSHEDAVAAKREGSSWGKWCMAKPPSVLHVTPANKAGGTSSTRPQSARAALRALQAIKAGVWQGIPRSGRHARVRAGEAKPPHGRADQRRSQSGQTSERPRGVCLSARSIAEERQGGCPATKKPAQRSSAEPCPGAERWREPCSI